MNTQEINKILTDTIYIFGEDSQIWMAIEDINSDYETSTGIKID